MSKELGMMFLMVAGGFLFMTCICLGFGFMEMDGLNFSQWYGLAVLSTILTTFCTYAGVKFLE